MFDVWKNVLAEIEQQISPANFATWFQDTSLVTAKDGHVIIGVKNSFYVKQLRARYYDYIKKSLESHGITVKDIEFEVVNVSKSKVRSREVTAPEPIKKRIKAISHDGFSVGWCRRL